MFQPTALLSYHLPDFDYRYRRVFFRADMWSHMCELPWWFSVSLQQRLHLVWTGPLWRWVCTQDKLSGTRGALSAEGAQKPSARRWCFPFPPQISMNAAWTMVVVSTAVRTLWGDLNAFAILAISSTGTRRTVLVSHLGSWEANQLNAVAWYNNPYRWNTWGIKTGDTFDSLLFLCTFLSLGFHVLMSSILDAVRTFVLPSGPTFVLMQNAVFCLWFWVFFLVSFTLEFCSDFHLEAQGLPPATLPSKPTLNCSKQEGGDRCFLTCQSQVHISSGEFMHPPSLCQDRVCVEHSMITGLQDCTDSLWRQPMMTL